MRHLVVITDPADRNFREHFQWIRERSPQGAEAWRARIIEAVKTLEVSPELHALARESAVFPAMFGVSPRMVTFRRNFLENVTMRGLTRNTQIATERLFALLPENVKEHAPLSAGPHVDHGVEVVTTEDHENRAADRGCCVSACSASWIIG